MFDTSGNRFVDLISGALNCNFGYANEVLDDVFQRSIKDLRFLHGRNFLNKTLEEYSCRLSKILNNEYISAFGVTGSDGIELALRIAWICNKKHNRRRNGIIYLGASYHGATLLSLSMSISKAGLYSDFCLGNTIEIPIFYQDGEARINVTHIDNNLDAFDKCFAFVCEPIIANAAGGICLNNGDLKYLIGKLKERNVSIIFDEIAVSFGRVGSIFTSYSVGVKPDMIVCSKGVTAGYYPCSIVMTKTEVYSNFLDSEYHNVLGHTFSGQPVIGSIGNKILDFLDDKFLSNVVSKGNKIYDIVSRCSKVVECRSYGMLIGIDIDGCDNHNSLNEFFLENGFVVLTGKNPRTGAHILLAPALNTNMDRLYTYVEEVGCILSKYSNG